MKPRCGFSVCENEATTTVLVLVDEPVLASYEMPICPDHEQATRELPPWPDPDAA